MSDETLIIRGQCVGIRTRNPTMFWKPGRVLVFVGERYVDASPGWRRRDLAQRFCRAHGLRFVDWSM